MMLPASAEEARDDPALAPTLPAKPDALAASSLSPAVEAMRRRLSERLFGEAQEAVYLGRFRIRETLGAGGMGVVFAAYDDKLERPVALKVIRARQKSQRSDDHQRLLAEARALARLSHPAVVQVYDVGEAGDDVFIAMEQIHGVTLERWLATEPRRLADILERFVAAGRGLAAAHAVGVVHRDFKPSNVLVGEDGRVRLIDFGLAQGAEELGAGAKQVAGTPAFMPPEAFMGSGVDTRGDQFSFCVALYEAVYDRPPFAAGVLRALAERRPPVMVPVRGGRAVPRWLRRILARGLAFAPVDRFPTLDAMLDALVRIPRGRRRAVLAVLAAAGVVAATIISARLSRPPDPCFDEGKQLAGIWDLPRREQVVSVLGMLSAGATARVVGPLDDFATRWRTTRRAVCEATWRGEQSERLLDLGMLCLERHRRSLAAATDLLTQGDRERLIAAEELVAALPDPYSCSDREALLGADAMTSFDPRSEAIDAALQRIDLMHRARQGHEVVAPLEKAIADAAALGRHDLEARGLLLRGKIARVELEDVEAAADWLDRAYELAFASRHDFVLWSILSELTLVSVEIPERASQARTLLGHARSALRRLPRTDPAAEATLRNVEAVVVASEGRFADAVNHRREALRIRRTYLPEEHPDVLSSRLAEARALDVAGESRRARDMLKGLADELIRLRGPSHPITLIVLHEYADVLLALGEDKSARAVLEKVRPELAAQLGLGSARIAGVDIRLAQIAEREGRLDAAIAAGEAARAVLARIDAAPVEDRVAALAVLANSYGRLRRWSDALPLYSELLVLSEARPDLGVDVPALLSNIGNTHCMLDRCDEALPHYTRLLTEYARAPPEDPTLAALPLQGLGRIHLARGTPELAVPLLERALELLRQRPDAEPQLHASTARRLAQALGELHVDRRRVRRLMREADTIERKLATAPAFASGRSKDEASLP